MINVLLVDDHGLVRAGWKSLLAGEPDIRVVGEASDGLTAIKLTESLTPDVVMMDIGMPGMNGIDACREIHKNQPEVRVIVLSMHGEKRFVAEAFRAGALGYVLKDSPLEELARSIRKVHSGLKYASPEIAGVLVDSLTGDGGSVDGVASYGETVLTPRQRQILQLLAEGQNSLEIADFLGISGKTVDAHRRNIMETLRIFTVAELTHYAIKEGITTLRQ